MEVEETSVVEVFVDGESHGVTQTEHAAEIVGSRTQMGDLTEELHGMTLLLQRILFRIGTTVNLYCFGLHLYRLALTLRFNQLTGHMDTRTGGNLLEQSLVEFLCVGHHLQIGHDGTIIESDELHEIVAASGTHPTFNLHGVANADNLRSLDNIF